MGGYELRTAWQNAWESAESLGSVIANSLFTQSPYMWKCPQAMAGAESSLQSLCLPVKHPALISAVGRQSLVQGASFPGATLSSLCGLR